MFYNKLVSTYTPEGPKLYSSAKKLLVEEIFCEDRFTGNQRAAS